MRRPTAIRRSLFVGACAGIWLSWQALAGLTADPPKSTAPVAKKTMRVGGETAARANKQFAARSKLDIAKGSAPVAPATTAGLSIDALKTMIDNLGFDCTEGTYDSGAKYVDLTIPRANWNFVFRIDGSADNSELWLHTWCCDIDNSDKVKPAALVKLLQAEDTIWPAYFTITADGKSLYLYRPLPNVDIKPASLRTTIEGFMDIIQNTNPQWDATNFNDPAPAAPAAPASKTGS